MIQLYVITKDEKMAGKIASELVKEKFAVAVRVDYNQHYFFLNDKDLPDERIVHVVMGLTKALLFNECLDFIHSRFDKNIFVYSIPITQANDALSDIVRNSTRKV
jgi:uncharacterized protein involved in tolerance to divalent cations